MLRGDRKGRPGLKRFFGSPGEGLYFLFFLGGGQQHTWTLFMYEIRFSPTFSFAIFTRLVLDFVLAPSLVYCGWERATTLTETYGTSTFVFK